jgi:transcriptional regulator with XRE-family HTH domain
MSPRPRRRTQRGRDCAGLRNTSSAAGRILRRERIARKITQEKLAELADLNIKTLQKIEAGQTNILVETAIRLRKALGCPWDSLMGK